MSITRTIRGIPTELRLGPPGGMPTECVASFDNLYLIWRADLTERICSLGPDRMDEACAGPAATR